jgi:hypothetical protein
MNLAATDSIGRQDGTTSLEWVKHSTGEILAENGHERALKN